MRRALFIALIATAFIFIGVLSVSVFLPPNLTKDHDRSQTVSAKDGSILRPLLSKDGIWRTPKYITSQDTLNENEGERSRTWRFPNSTNDGVMHYFPITNVETVSQIFVHIQCLRSLFC